MNKIALIGQSKENGYGIVQERGDVFLIKQPFDVSNKILLKGDEIDDAFALGFEPIEAKEFADYSSLEKYLNELITQTKKELGAEEEKVDLSIYYKTLPIELIELNIDFLEDYLDDYPYIHFVFQALQANPEFQRIDAGSKKKLGDFLSRAKCFQREEMLTKKETTFQNIDIDEWENRSGFHLGLKPAA